MSGYLENAEVEALTKKAKDNKIMATIHKAKAEDKPKTKRETTKKENPTKEKIIKEVAALLESLGAEEIAVTNSTKLVEFKMAGNEYKIDLIQKRPPKK